MDLKDRLPYLHMEFFIDEGIDIKSTNTELRLCLEISPTGSEFDYRE